MVKAFESWRLFWLLALVATVISGSGLSSAAPHSAREMEPLILRSVRCALPLFLLAFTASSLATLWPNRATRWLLSNRRYIGLAFAFAMGWHFSLVAYSIFLFGNRLSATSTTLDVIAATFLLLMTLTSFRWSARRLGTANWRRLHKSGVYVIWFLAASIYLGAVRAGGSRLDCAVLSLLLAAWLLRIAAAVKHRIHAEVAAASGAVGNGPRSRSR